MQYRFTFLYAVRVVVLSVLGFGAAGCFGMLGPEAAAPTASGDHPVGVTTIVVKDPARERWLTTEVWYPAATETAGEPEVYKVTALDLTVARLRSPLGAHRDVEPWRVGGPRPVVLMSHGRGSTRLGNVSLAETLASNGYIVAAPDHSGHTIDAQLNGIGDEERAQSAMDRPIDLSRVLDDLLVRSGQRASLLRELVDADRVAVAGHSFGGLAALGLTGAEFDSARQRKDCRTNDDDWRCAAVPVFGAEPYRYRDPRIKASVLITPAGYDLYRGDGVARVDVPTLVVGARRDQNTPFAEFSKPTYDALKGPHYLLALENAGHLTATDVCNMIDSIGFFAKTFGGKDARDGCGLPGNASRDALESVVSVTLPFLSLHIDGDATAADRLRVALETQPTPPSSAPALPRNVARVSQHP